MSAERRSAIPVLVGVVLLITLVGVVVLVRGGDRTPDQRPHTDDGAAPVAVTNPDATLVAMDGWSMRTLSGAGRPRVDGAAVSWRAASQSDVELLIERDPGGLAALLERMLPVAATAPSCAPSTGCLYDGAPVPSEWFSDPSTVPGLGPSYQSWGVTALVFVADAAPSQGTSVSVPAPDWEPLTLTPSSGPSSGSEVPEDLPTGVDLPTTTAPAAPSESAAPTAYTVAAGLGRVWPAVPPTLGRADNGAGFFTGLASTVSAARTSAPETPFMAGLASPDPLVAVASPVFLSWATSPSTGCGVGVLCIPDVVEATVERLGASQLTICRGDNVFDVDVEDVVVEVTFEHPTHQLGVWGGVEPRPHPELSGVVLGVPALTSGAQKLRLTTTRTFASQSILVESRGSVRTFGVDPDADGPTATATGAVTAALEEFSCEPAAPPVPLAQPGPLG